MSIMAPPVTLRTKEDTVTAQPEDSLAPAAGGGEKEDQAREIFPVQMWDKTSERDLYDFRGVSEEVEEEEAPVAEVDPKASSATSSVLSEIYETLRTPDVDWSALGASHASAEKEPTPEPKSETGSQDGSEETSTKAGKSEPSAAK